jgi:hypothetical protein
MKNLHIVYDETEPFADGLVNYIDEFDPLDSIPFERVQMAGMQVVPPLIAALEQQDLRPMIGHKLATVEKLYRASGGRMRRLIQTNDRRYHPNATPADTMVLALMRGTEPKGCIASRLLWCERTLAEEMESGRFWATQPGLWGKSDRCVVTAVIARAIRACHIVFTGSVWLSQDVTGGATLAAMMRLHHLWVICHWRWTWLVGMIEGTLARRHAFDVYGGMALDLGLWRTRPGEDDQLHEYELTSCERSASMETWLRPEMGDLSLPIGRPSLVSACDRQRTG